MLLDSKQDNNNKENKQLWFEKNHLVQFQNFD